MSSSFNAVKLVLLGDSGVGKTSIVTQYVSGAVPENVSPTIGAAFVTKEVSLEGESLELLIWDTAGQEVYRGLAPMYYRSALIAIVVYDVTNQDSFNSVSYWVRELQTNAEAGIVVLVCGNKTDLEERRAVQFEGASALAAARGALYAETSATANAGVDRMFQLALSSYLRKRAAPGAGGAPPKVDIGAAGERPPACC